VDVATIIVGVASAAAGLLGGGGLVGYLQNRALTRRTQTQDFWDSFEKQIQLSESAGDEARVASIRLEYSQQLEAWRAEQGLEKIVPRGTILAEDANVLADAEIEQLAGLLGASEPLSPALQSGFGHFLRGNAHMYVGNFREAAAAYRRSLNAAPDRPETLGNLAVSLIKLQEPHKRRWKRRIEPWISGLTIHSL
jgi:tetratricopeptide (TPR) repeat protein